MIEDLLTRVASSTDIREACEEVEDWFSRHDLVDLTTCGPQCPAYVNDPPGDDWCAVIFAGQVPGCSWFVNSGQPCSVMAARKETP